MTSYKIYKLIEDNGLTLHGDIEHFAALVRADEAEKYKWDVHSCGPTCTKVACVAMREAVQAEREACAKWLEDVVDAPNWAEIIRARGDKHD